MLEAVGQDKVPTCEEQCLERLGRLGGETIAVVKGTVFLTLLYVTLPAQWA